MVSRTSFVSFIVLPQDFNKGNTEHGLVPQLWRVVGQHVFSLPSVFIVEVISSLLFSY